LCSGRCRARHWHNALCHDAEPLWWRGERLRGGANLAQSNDGFYAWKPGEASWHKVAPALAGIVNRALVVFDQASGKETLYLEVRPDQGNSYSFYSIVLA
jgi:hypothetical protein